MAITTVDGALAGMVPPSDFAKAVTPTLVAGRPHSLWYLAGTPGAGSAPGASLTGAVVNATTAGQLAFTNPGAGNSYLARFQATGITPGTLMLCDRIWANGAIVATTTTAQTFTSSVQIGARDATGTTSGVGVQIGIEVSAAMGAATPTPTVNYTNSAGTAAKVGTAIDIGGSSAAAGSFHRVGLATGDVGVQKAESITLGTSWLSGTCHVVLYRVLARLELTSANIGNSVDALTSGFPRIYNDTVPFLIFIPSTTTATSLSGHAIWTQG